MPTGSSPPSASSPPSSTAGCWACWAPPSPAPPPSPAWRNWLLIVGLLVTVAAMTVKGNDSDRLGAAGPQPDPAPGRRLLPRPVAAPGPLPGEHGNLFRLINQTFRSVGTI